MTFLCGTVHLCSQVLTEEPPAPTMALPAVMIGDFQMETSEGFNDFMYELSVNIVTRNIANNLYPLQQLRQDKDDEMITLGWFLINIP